MLKPEHKIGLRVLRGGGRCYLSNCRLANRIGGNPDYCLFGSGFFVVRMFRTSSGKEEGVDELKHTYKQSGGTASKEDLEKGLLQFSGTEAYHRWNPLVPNYVLTDGALYLAKEAGAFWLMDAIASYWREVKRDEEFKSLQYWTLETSERKGILKGMNGNREVKISQIIEWTDFPLERIELFVAPADEAIQVIMLPSEY